MSDAARTDVISNLQHSTASERASADPAREILYARDVTRATYKGILHWSPTYGGSGAAGSSGRGRELRRQRARASASAGVDDEEADGDDEVEPLLAGRIRRRRVRGPPWCRELPGGGLAAGGGAPSRGEGEVAGVGGEGGVPVRWRGRRRRKAAGCHRDGGASSLDRACNIPEI
jgi:hypothetical protein